MRDGVVDELYAGQRTLVEDASSDDDYDWRAGMRPW